MEKSSYEKINYSLRPAKAIERKMLCESMRRLAFFQNIENYQYVGFGSTYFSDFSLVHKLLGISDLISIEKDKNNSKRFNFNKPFSCVKIIFGPSDQILPYLNWKKRSIVWVDYDQKINESILSDIKTFFFSAKSGSLFIITIDVRPDEIDHDKEESNLESRVFSINEQIEFRYRKLVERIGFERVPIGTDVVNLNLTNNPKIIYKIVNDEILDILSKRNGGLSKRHKIRYKQLFHFLYNDGTPMLTIGGLIYKDHEQELLNKMDFSKLDFISNDEKAFKIEVPKLTYKEINALDALLPQLVNRRSNKIRRSKNVKIPHLSDDDIKKYSKIYRYFPNFAETNY